MDNKSVDRAIKKLQEINSMWGGGLNCNFLKEILKELKDPEKPEGTLFPVKIDRKEPEEKKERVPTGICPVCKEMTGYRIFGGHIIDNDHQCWKCQKIFVPKEKKDYRGVHLSHCYQGENEGICKYGEEDCPAKPEEKEEDMYFCRKCGNIRGKGVSIFGESLSKIRQLISADKRKALEIEPKEKKEETFKFDTPSIPIPEGETFVTFRKEEDRLFVVTDKAVHEVVKDESDELLEVWEKWKHNFDDVKLVSGCMFEFVEALKQYAESKKKS